MPILSCTVTDNGHCHNRYSQKYERSNYLGEKDAIMNELRKFKECLVTIYFTCQHVNQNIP